MFVGLVTSEVAHAKILSINASKALAIPGVIDFFCHKDIPGRNHFFVEEQLMATDEVRLILYILYRTVRK